MILNGENIGLHIVEVNRDGFVSVREFEKEEAGIKYSDDNIIIDTVAMPNKIRISKDNRTS